MLSKRTRIDVLAPPRRSGADLVVHAGWDAGPGCGVDPAALLAWVRRCRAQGVRVHVDVVSPDAVRRSRLLGLCATALAMHVPLPMPVLDEPAPGDGAEELCRQLHLTGAGARVVARSRPSRVPFVPGLPAPVRPLRR